MTDMANVISMNGLPMGGGYSGPMTLDNIFNLPELFVNNAGSDQFTGNGFTHSFRVGIPVPADGMPHTLTFGVQDVQDGIWDSYILISDISTQQTSGAGDMKYRPAGQLSVATQGAAQRSLETIDVAIKAVSSVRAHLGALQNRLENTIANLQIQSENLQAAESRISDADVAAEVTAFVGKQIAVQAATAMLAQANNLPQMALGLLKG